MYIEPLYTACQTLNLKQKCKKIIIKKISIMKESKCPTCDTYAVSILKKIIKE